MKTRKKYNYLCKYQACDAYYYHRRMDNMLFHRPAWLAAKN